MAGNSFGQAFRITTAGESHGPGNVVIIDGCPAGIALSKEDLMVDLARTPVYVARAGAQLWSLALPIAVAAAGCLAGTVWGERLLLRMGPATYRRLVGAAVGAIGVWLLARAL